MTVIAWDGTTLAADKRSTTEYGTITLTTKIGRHKNALWAEGGHEPEGLELLAWWKDGAHPKDFPAVGRENKATLVIVTRETSGPLVLCYTKGPYPATENEGGVCAFGTGRDIALAVMHLGKSAREAVLMASKLNAWCGDGVDVLRLDEYDSNPSF